MIVDECHHISAVNFEKVLKSANAKYVYGLTATPTRQDGHHPIIFMQCGPMRYKVDAKEQAEKRPFEHYLIPRFTSFRSAADKTITTLYKELSENQLRNNLIANDVIEALSDGRTPIILTERREHIETISGLLSGKCDNIITLFGTGSQKEKRETLAKLESIPDNEKLIIIATGKYVGEGFDYPRLDTLFLALPIAWKGKVAQYTGRLHRNYIGKTEVQVYDYVDIHVPMLEKMYQKRVKGYAAVGYKAKIKTNEPITPNLIYDGKSFYPVFADDVMHATKEILIVTFVAGNSEWRFRHCRNPSAGGFQRKRTRYRYSKRRIAFGSRNPCKIQIRISSEVHSNRSKSRLVRKREFSQLWNTRGKHYAL